MSTNTLGDVDRISSQGIQHSVPRTPRASKTRTPRASPEGKSPSLKIISAKILSSGSTSGDEDYLSLSSWLIVCKLLALFQSQNIPPTRKTLRAMLSRPRDVAEDFASHSLMMQIPGSLLYAADPESLSSPPSYNTQQKLVEEPSPTSTFIASIDSKGDRSKKDFKVELVGWQLCREEDYYNARFHVKFKLSSNAEVVCQIPELENERLHSLVPSSTSSTLPAAPARATDNSVPLQRKITLQRVICCRLLRGTWWRDDTVISKHSSS
jgi:hypothetical protein